MSFCFWLGRVVRDVCGTVVHVLDLWVQRPMAHQVSLAHSSDAPASRPLGSDLITSCWNLGYSSSVRIHPPTRSSIYNAYTRSIISNPHRLLISVGCRGDVLGHVPYVRDGVDVVELHRR